jgi:catechol 2,3-dioxygenase-like lactoylglutathione lyase family enzyme
MQRPGPARLNHVSVSARDLDESTAFYRDLLGLEPVPAPNFGFPVRWLRIGDLQLHLFELAEPAPARHHFAVSVDDFAAAYARAREMDVLDRETFGHHLYELPGDCVQLYVRDPAGNCVEIDGRGAAALDRSVRADLRPLPHPQSEENQLATLFLETST